MLHQLLQASEREVLLVFTCVMFERSKHVFSLVLNFRFGRKLSMTAWGTHVEVRGQLCSQFIPSDVMWILELELRLPDLCGTGLSYRAVLPALGLRLYHM